MKSIYPRSPLVPSTKNTTNYFLQFVYTSDIDYHRGMKDINGITRKRKRTPAKKANTLTPQQNQFLEYYYDPENTDTFGNVYKSALKAGYSDSYARLMRAPSVGNAWIHQWNNKKQFTQDHIVAGITSLAVNAYKDGDKLRALELLAKIEGMLVDKQITATMNIEEALRNLK